MIAVGSDHAGFELKCEILRHLANSGVEYKDYGTYSTESVDYPTYALKVCNAVVNGEAETGILVCGTGIGVSIAANKVKGIRAALCSNEFSTEFTRRHNDANVMCLGGRVTATEDALKYVDIFLNTPFEGGKHKRRIDMIADIENGSADFTEEK